MKFYLDVVRDPKSAVLSEKRLEVLSELTLIPDEILKLLRPERSKHEPHLQSAEFSVQAESPVLKKWNNDGRCTIKNTYTYQIAFSGLITGY